MRFCRPRFVAAIGIVVVAIGCEGVFVDQALHSQNYSNGDFEYAARHGTIKTAVVGDPFGNTRGLAAMVTQYMHGANRGPTVKFVAQPEGTDSAPFHVVMVFNPLPHVTGADACRKISLVETVPGTEPIHLLAAFCSVDIVMSEAGGRIGGVSGPEDAKFRSLVRQVTLAMIPPHDRRRTPF